MGLSTAKNVVRMLAHHEAGVHAILLYGAKGAGKTELANVIAQLWLCTHPTAAGADGTCRACLAFDRGNSPDVLLIEPQGNSRIIRDRSITTPKDKEPDDPIPLVVFLRTPPISARHKVVIIRDAHRMNGASANALLKTLEEPPSYAKLLLTTDSVGSILPTVLSRCLAVACEAPSLVELIGAFPDATPEEIRISEGTAGRLNAVFARRAAYGRLLQFAHRLPNRGAGEALVASEEFQAIVERIQPASEAGARAANADALDVLAIYFAREPSCPPSWTQQIIEAHRRIVANGQASIVFDALFTGLLAR